MAEKVKQNGRTTLREVFAVMRTEELGPVEKVLWGLYRSYDSGNGAWPGDEVLAAHMGRKVRSCASDMIRVHMCRDDVGSRCVGHCLGKDCRPDLLRFFGPDTGIDNRPTRIVAQQPEIDVVKRERQWHA